MKAKKLREALQQLAEEGVVQVFRPTDGSPALVGVVGPLQLDVLQVRLKEEYGLDVMWDTAEYALARWISSADPKALATFVKGNGLSIAEDIDGDPVFLARNQFYLDYTRERAPGIVFTDVKDRHANGKAV
jgi:peptide chain release factor 3